MSRDCAEAYAKKQHQHTIAQHPRYVAAASLRQCDDRHSHDDHPSAAVYARAVQSIAGWSAGYRPTRSVQAPLQLSLVCPFRPILLQFPCSGMPRAAAVSVWPGIRMRSVRWEQRATQGQNMRLEPRPAADQTIHRHFLTISFSPIKPYRLSLIPMINWHFARGGFASRVYLSHARCSSPIAASFAPVTTRRL
jgi:hypothetical protein